MTHQNAPCRLGTKSAHKMRQSREDSKNQRMRCMKRQHCWKSKPPMTGTMLICKGKEGVAEQPANFCKEQMAFLTIIKLVVDIPCICWLLCGRTNFGIASALKRRRGKHPKGGDRPQQVLILFSAALLNARSLSLSLSLPFVSLLPALFLHPHSRYH